MKHSSKKAHLVFAFTLHALVTTSLQANKIPEELKEFNHTRYNSLPLSAEADGELKRNGKLSAFLQEATKIADKYDVSSSVGFRLLHRHEILEKGKVMVESFDYWKSQPAFITTKEDKETSKLYPASWSLSESGMKVFEFSTDPQVKSIAKKLGSNCEFFGEVRQLLEEYQLEKILAPAVLTREAFIHFDRTQPLYEIIKPQPYASVLVNKSWEEIEKESERGTNLVRTTWSLGGMKDGEVICGTYCHSSDDDWKWHVFQH